MRTLIDHLSNYADYHRDRRNILTHLVGVPLIVSAVAILLSRPALDVVAECAFALGLRPEVHAEVLRRSGPTRIGRPSQLPAA